MGTRIVVAAALSAMLGVTSAAQVSKPAGAQLTPAIVDPAVAIQKSLAKDSLAGVKGNAEIIARESTTRLDPPSPAIAKAAQALRGAATLAGARTAFGGLSVAIVDYMHANKLTLDPRIHVAYCPMADRPWLQAGTVVANPYYGTAMPTCGSIRQ
ncbi:MAG: hypothetical protein ACM3SQ_15000 [Betaproteobacteria bacterium]